MLKFSPAKLQKGVLFCTLSIRLIELQSNFLRSTKEMSATTAEEKEHKLDCCNPTHCNIQIEVYSIYPPIVSLPNMTRVMVLYSTMTAGNASLLGKMEKPCIMMLCRNGLYEIEV